MAEVILSNGGKALVDDSDLSKISGYKWLKDSQGYAVCHTYSESGRRIMLKMHRVIVNACSSDLVDHRNTDERLDNRRSNLRIATHSLNGANRRKSPTHAGRKTTSKFKGVTWEYKSWLAQVRVNGKLLRLGKFQNETGAAEAYDSAAVRHFGQFARTNFPVLPLYG